MEAEGEEQGRMARILSRWVGVDMLLSPMTQVSRMSSSLSLELGSCDPAAPAPAPPPQQRGTKQRKVIPIGRRT